MDVEEARSFRKSWARVMDESKEIDENSATFNDDDDEGLPPPLTHCSLVLLSLPKVPRRSAVVVGKDLRFTAWNLCDAALNSNKQSNCA